MKGYYSVMQYCPDPSRGEAANVGVVLLTEQPHTITARTSDTFARVKRFFRPDERRLARIMDAVRANAARLQNSAEEVRTLADLDHFSRTMGNDIRLTPPLVVRVEDAQRDLLNLYDELVGDSLVSPARRPVVLPTSINRVFEELTKEKKITKPGHVSIPLLGRKLHIPYAYRNGVLNYVKPTLFADESDTTERAARLAVEGDQIRKHPIEDLSGHVPRRLIVVSSASSDLKAEAAVAPLFAEYGVTYVPQSAAEEFAHRVRREAK